MGNCSIRVESMTTSLCQMYCASFSPGSSETCASSLLNPHSSLFCFWLHLCVFVYIVLMSLRVIRLTLGGLWKYRSQVIPGLLTLCSQGKVWREILGMSIGLGQGEVYVYVCLYTMCGVYVWMQMLSTMGSRNQAQTVKFAQQTLRCWDILPALNQPFI